MYIKDHRADLGIDLERPSSLRGEDLPLMILHIKGGRGDKRMLDVSDV